MDTLRVLCLDCDDVIIRTNSIVEPIIEKIEYKASESWLMNINRMFKNKIIDRETKELLIDEHFDYKDRVLEEVDEKYHNRINYYEVITKQNIYKGAIEYINYLCDCGYYNQVIIVSHCNVEREICAKEQFFALYTPKVQFVPVPFHKESYEPGKKRFRTNKALYLKEYLCLQNIGHYTLIDDSTGNGKEWVMEGGNYCRFNPTEVPNNANEIGNLHPITLMATATYPLLDSNEHHTK